VGTVAELVEATLLGLVASFDRLSDRVGTVAELVEATLFGLVASFDRLRDRGGYGR
jgi:hypothetical protein